MILGLFFFFFSIKCESEIPFENEQEIVGGEEKMDLNEVEENEEQEIEKEEADVKSTPQPQLVQVSVPLSQILGIKEVGIGCLILLYIIIFFVGKSITKSKINKISNKLNPELRKYFAVVPDKFIERNYHQYDTYITGRKGYVGCLISPRFAKTCDPLGFLMRIVTSEKDMIAFEFILDPKYNISGMLHVSKDKPYFADDLKLKSHSLGQKLQLWTDFGDEQRKVFTKIINSFMEDNPGVLQLIELSNQNRFETRDSGHYVARIELNIEGPIDEFLSDELLEFVMNISDSFTMLKLPSDIQTRNERTRILLAKERQPKEEKKLTKEEEERLEKKKERKEKRLHSGFKVSKY
ncbi:hypothetical protein GPJ56_003817 [Histomonas meleagridis]|uniref:uncharacterized protein n=1 Tax=Histomonas meleagridis TaxID=135588 RepID=UPI00355A25DC|nr:hypothetical protein GPJ56_003817 [Histomonas meleagridis]KAH0805275.1 hypothetical protein GO595_002220 [Histomonas meleagridis]